MLKGPLPGIVPRLWRAGWHLSFLLGLLLVVVFVLYPMSDRSVLLGAVLQAVFSLVLISGVPVVGGSRTLMALAGLLAAGTAAIGWIRLYSPSGFLTVLGVSMWILFFSMLAGVILIRVFSEGGINLHRIQGAVAVYLLLGVIWSGCYRLVLYVDPAAFNMPPAAAESTLMSKLVYFSFVTLTTVGYGDMTAVHPAARSLTMLEALAGQLFPAILIARLVSMEGSRQDGDRIEPLSKRVA
jgi:hypothetical protein